MSTNNELAYSRVLIENCARAAVRAEHLLGAGAALDLPDVLAELPGVPDRSVPFPRPGVGAIAHVLPLPRQRVHARDVALPTVEASDRAWLVGIAWGVTNGAVHAAPAGVADVAVLAAHVRHAQPRQVVESGTALEVGVVLVAGGAGPAVVTNEPAGACRGKVFIRAGGGRGGEDDDEGEEEEEEWGGGGRGGCEGCAFDVLHVIAFDDCVWRWM